MAGSSLTGMMRHHCFVALSKNINPSLVQVQPRKTCPFTTERLLIGRKESNQIKQNKNNKNPTSTLPKSNIYTTKIQPPYNLNHIFTQPKSNIQATKNQRPNNQNPKSTQPNPCCRHTMLKQINILTLNRH